LQKKEHTILRIIKYVYFVESISLYHAYSEQQMKVKYPTKDNHSWRGKEGKVVEEENEKA